ncbi:proton-conducting transporter membrane subunit, partial [Dokdonella sp.]|uniref:proton-conducting transporter transmembrane domain-containing protein n=1 Tax=Dokdonella sp. TaxID=2291710 RepID=UPI002F3E9092
MSPYLLPLCGPLLLVVAALFACLPGGRRSTVPAIAEGSAIGALLVALASLALLVARGAGDSPLLGGHGIGLSVRLDTVSSTMLLLVSFVGWIVVRYARTYVHGEPRYGAFLGGLCATLASVLLLVQAGNLVQLVGAWIATSVALRRLLLFYPQRRAAQRAARKKRLFSAIGAAALIVAAILLATAFGTTDVGAIDALARTRSASWLEVAAASLFAVAAVLKSAQFPTHGWLTEVMEAPTPVSALLHAGVINAGGFLLVRFADVMLLAPGVLA